MHTLAYREALAPNSLGSEQPRTWDLPRTSYDVRLQSLGSPRAPSLEAPQTLDGGASGSSTQVLHLESPELQQNTVLVLPRNSYS